MPATPQSFPNSSITTLSRRQRLLSIRWTLPLCVLAPLLSGILLSSWFAFRSGQKAVNELVGKISAEVAGNIQKEVDNYLTKSSLISAKGF